jgi:hypothetical protein
MSSVMNWISGYGEHPLYGINSKNHPITLHIYLEKIMNQSMVISMFFAGEKINLGELNKLLETKLKQTSLMRIKEGVKILHKGLCLNLEVQGNIIYAIDALVYRYNIDIKNVFLYCDEFNIEISFNIYLSASSQYYDLEVDCLMKTSILSELGIKAIYIYNQDLFPIEVPIDKSISSVIFKDIADFISVENRKYQMVQNKNNNRKKDDFFSRITNQSPENRDRYRTFTLHRDNRISKNISGKHSLVSLEESSEIIKYRIGFRMKYLSPTISVLLMLIIPLIVWMFSKDPYATVGTTFLGILNISKFIDIVNTFFLYHPENDLRILTLSIERKKEDSIRKESESISYFSSFRFEEVPYEAQFTLNANNPQPLQINL